MAYEHIRRLARGGMGVVDLARADDGSLVALKRLALHGTAEEMQLARLRFDRERAVLDALDHPAVVPLLDVVDDDGDVVLVLPYLAGGSLSDRVREDGPLPTTAVQAMAERLLPALAAAHRLGIIHRDIKPANILFDDAGNAHLADFGVALTRDVTDGLTRTGVVLGTPGFLSPEQARGEELTAASDVASLGATLHFAATGRSPYGGGDAPAVLLRTARARASVDRAIEPGLRRTIAAMLDARADRRPTAAALAGGAAGTNPIPLLVRRHRRTLLAGTAALVLLAGGAWAVSALGGADDPVEEAAPDTTAPASTTTTEACLALRYQPCGRDPAPNTDGRRCIDDTADYDGFTTNGCEAEPDRVDGTELVDRIAATIVPADDVDRYPFHVDDEGDFGCNNTFRLELTAPRGVTLRLVVLDDDGDVVAETTSADGIAGEIAMQDPRCFRGDDGDFVAEVRATGSDRTADRYVLTRSGSF